MIHLYRPSILFFLGLQEVTDYGGLYVPIDALYFIFCSQYVFIETIRRLTLKLIN